MGKFLLILGRGVGQVMFQNNALSGALLWETRHGAGGCRILCVIICFSSTFGNECRDYYTDCSVCSFCMDYDRNTVSVAYPVSC